MSKSIHMIVTTRGARMRGEPPQFSADLGTGQVAQFTMPDGTTVEVEERDGELSIRTPEGGLAIQPRHSNQLAVTVVPL